MTRAELFYALGELASLVRHEHPIYVPNLIEAVNTITQQDKRIAEALEYCEDREDIVDGEFGPRPNDFMHLATILKGCVA